MAVVKIAEQLKLLRKQKGLTQEEVAEIFNVSNQAVSKWESGICTPDVSLLPDIAAFYQVSLDELFGNIHNVSLESIYLMMASYLNSLNKIEDKFNAVYQIGRLAHCAMSEKDKQYSESILKGKSTNNVSMYQSSGGVIVQGCNSFFSSSFKDFPTLDIEVVTRRIRKYLNIINDRDVLNVMFNLFESMLSKEFCTSVTIDEIIETTKLKKSEILDVFDKIEIYSEQDIDGVYKYSLNNLSIIPLLLTLVTHFDFTQTGIISK